MSRYQIVKMGEEYAVRKRLFFIGPWLYLSICHDWFLWSVENSNFLLFDLKWAQSRYDILNKKVQIEVIL